MNNIVIREAILDDINKGLLELYIEGYRYHQEGKPESFPNLEEDELKEKLINNFERLETLIALIGNNIIGYISYEIKEKRTKKIDIDQLVIKEEYRKNGIGKLLLNKVEEIAKENNCKKIEFNCWTFNENALAVYDHMGFKRQRIIYEKFL